MSNNYLLEIAVFNYSSAVLAEQAGADRLELCENAGEGGTTPSHGTLKQVKDKIQIPVFPIIRPRGGDFLYTADELLIMKQDIELCKQLDFEGVVFGMLLPDGKVDKENCKRLVDLAYPLDVTFHRAFDRTMDAFEALQDIIECGCTRILTSGQVPNVPDGVDLIKKLMETADGRIVIMPGSGLRSSNVLSIADSTGAVEFHSSARTNLPSLMEHSNAKMGESNHTVSVNVEEIRRTKEIIMNMK
ncbi:MAG TPA: copper homeostasis protein CutC [Segetibacter sp.]|jgi:copper homeostasis protein